MAQEERDNMKQLSRSAGIGVVLAALVAFSATAEWRLKQVAVVEGLEVPECLLADPDNGVVYISNIVAGEDEYWSNDGKGFISRMTPKGKMEQLRWLDSGTRTPINSPKGMCLLDGFLYFTDNAQLMKYPVDGSGPIVVVPLPRTDHLNDLATDGEFIYATDTTLGLIYKVGPHGGQTLIQSPESVNGITCWKGKLFAVSWELHEVYELDGTGDGPPEPFGVAEHFTNPDGIEVLDDGTFIVSDFVGNKISSIKPDRKTVTTLAEVETPADIGLDRKRKLLYVPLFMKDQAIVFKLKK
jgi:DNA-binding beta-propeller fold protein YncE